jgi:hypothetical protein
MNILRLSIGIALLIAASFPVAAQETCGALLPNDLRASLQAANPAHRVPLESDSTSACVLDRRRSGGSLCLLAMAADFSGTGAASFAVVMPSRNGKDAPKLIVAIRTGAEWKLASLRMGQPVVSHLVVSTLPPGEYRETTAALPDGVTGRVVKSKHSGFMVSSCESWANGYFLLGDEWFSLALSD